MIGLSSRRSASYFTFLLTLILLQQSQCVLGKGQDEQGHRLAKSYGKGKGGKGSGSSYGSKGKGGKGTGGSYRADRYSDEDDNEISSYFEVGFDATDGAEDDLETAAEILRDVYNNRLTCSDPYDRQITQIDVISAALGDGQSPNLIARFSVVGTCDGCGRHGRFTSSERRRLGTGAIRGGGDRGSSGGSDSTCPSEESLYDAYRSAIQERYGSDSSFDIVDVIYLQEFDRLVESSKKQKQSDGRDKDGNKGKDKGGKDKGGKDKGGKDKGGKDKGGKDKGGKDKDDKKGKDKDGKKKGKDKDGKKKGKKNKGPCPSLKKMKLDPFLSFFELGFDTSTISFEGIDNASEILMEAYNNVIQRYIVDIQMSEVNVALVEDSTARRLLTVKVTKDEGAVITYHDDRALQVPTPSITSFVEAFGECKNCGGYTAGHQISNNRGNPNRGNNRYLKRRDLQDALDDGEEEIICPLEGQPSEEEVRIEYDRLIRLAQLENFNGVNNVDEIQAIPTPEPSSGPTATPSVSPSAKPSAAPSPNPTGDPTPTPSAMPTLSPSASPSASPSSKPSASPTPAPTKSGSMKNKNKKNKKKNQKDKNKKKKSQQNRRLHHRHGDAH